MSNYARDYLFELYSIIISEEFPGIYDTKKCICMCLLSRVDFELLEHLIKHTGIFYLPVCRYVISGNRADIKNLRDRLWSVREIDQIRSIRTAYWGLMNIISQRYDDETIAGDMAWESNTYLMDIKYEFAHAKRHTSQRLIRMF